MGATKPETFDAWAEEFKKITEEAKLQIAKAKANFPAGSVMESDVAEKFLDQIIAEKVPGLAAVLKAQLLHLVQTHKSPIKKSSAVLA